MWKTAVELFTNLVTLTQRVDRLEKRFDEQQKEIRHLSESVNQLVFEMQHARQQQQHTAQHEADERRMFMLQVENMILKSKLQLPPAAATESNDEE